MSSMFIFIVILFSSVFLNIWSTFIILIFISLPPCSIALVFSTMFLFTDFFSMGHIFLFFGRSGRIVLPKPGKVPSPVWALKIAQSIVTHDSFLVWVVFLHISSDQLLPKHPRGPPLQYFGAPSLPLSSLVAWILKQYRMYTGILQIDLAATNSQTHRGCLRPL